MRRQLLLVAIAVIAFGGAATAQTASFGPGPQPGPTPGQLPGTTTNDNAAAGNVGEYVTASLAQGSAISLTTNTPANVVSIALTAGDWDVSGTVSYVFQPTTNVANMVQGASSASATLQSPYTALSTNSTTATPSSNGTIPVNAIPTTRFSLATPTTIYLVTQSGFSVSTAAAFGSIRARRVR